jgi:ATP-dependent DNA helicase 2 subunit 2
MQVTKFRGEINLAGVVRIPVYTYAHTAEAKLPTLKKMTAKKAEAELAAEARGDAGAAGAGDGEDEAEADGAAGSGSVMFERRYFRADTEEKKEVGPEELAKAFAFGKEKFVVDPTDEELLKLPTERHLSLLAFTSCASIPRYALIGSADVVVPPPNNPVATNALSAMARALAEMKEVAFVRYVKRANGAPAVGILLPALKDLPPETAGSVPTYDPFIVRPSPLDIDCLYFVPLPFNEDIRKYTFRNFASEAKYTPNEEQLAAVDNLMDAMDLMHVVSD